MMGAYLLAIAMGRVIEVKSGGKIECQVVQEEEAS